MGNRRAVRVIVLTLAALVLAACGSTETPTGGEPPEPAPAPASPGSSLPTTDDGEVSVDDPMAELAVCGPPPFADQPPVAPPDELGELVATWANAHRDGVAGPWWDGRAEQFVVVAVDPESSAEQLAADLGLDLGAADVAVRVEAGARSASELAAIQERAAELADFGLVPSTGDRVWDTTVAIELEFLDEKSLAAVREVFAGDLDAVCVTGADPTTVPSDGPQPTDGDGWRLLHDETGAGESYAADVAVTEAEYELLWTTSGLTGEPPAVDFAEEIVIRFGATYSGSCPEIRMDDVVIDRATRTVTADIVLLGGNRACTADDNPRSYVVAVQRDRLPDVPFAVSPYPNCDWCRVAEVEDLDPDVEGSGDGGDDDAPKTQGDLTEQDLVGALAAAARHRVTVDNSFGGAAPFERIDVIETVGVTGADGFIDARDGRPLSDAEREAIEAALAPLPVEFVPATVFDELDPTQDPRERAIVTLARPAEVDRQLVIASQLWCGGLCAIGGAHELGRAADGAWSIGDPVGPQWIS